MKIFHIPQIGRKPQRHPIVTLSAVTTTLISIIEWRITPTTNLTSSITTIVFLSCIFLSAFWTPAAFCAIMCGFICSVSPFFNEGPSLLWGLWFSLSLIGYTFPIPISIIASALLSAGLWISAYLPQQETSQHGIAMMSASYFAAAMLGYFIFHLQEEKERKIAEAKLENAHRALSLAERETILTDRLHNSIANKLTSAILLIEANSDTPYSNTESAKELRHYIIDLLQQAIHETRILISEKNDFSDHMKGSSLMECVTIMTSSGDRYLHNLNMSGHTSVDIPEDYHPNQEFIKKISTIFEEIYINISKYADTSEADYRLITTVNRNCLLIDEYNHTSTHTQRRAYTHSNKGLSLIYNHVHALGGQMKISDQNGIWRLQCSLPFTQLLTEPIQNRRTGNDSL